jgi:hypothetical protein
VETVLWAVGAWAAMSVVTLAIVAAVVATLPVTYFRDGPADDPAGTTAGRATRRVVRNLCGLLLIVAGLLLSIPGVPGQGFLTLLAGVVLVDFPGRHRVACAIARWRGVLPTMNRLRARLGRPPLEPPEDRPHR